MIRRLRPFAFTAALLIGCAGICAQARAQGPAPPPPPAEGGGGGEEGGGGDPLYGYVATGFLCAGAIFVICKSARR
jgi:hypothetical protein